MKGCVLTHSPTRTCRTCSGLHRDLSAPAAQVLRASTGLQTTSFQGRDGADPAQTREVRRGVQEECIKATLHHPSPPRYTDGYHLKATVPRLNTELSAEGLMCLVRSRGWNLAAQSALPSRESTEATESFCTRDSLSVKWVR